MAADEVDVERGGQRIGAAAGHFIECGAGVEAGPAHQPDRALGRWRLDRWNDTRHLLGRELTHVDESDGRPLAL